MLPKLKNRIKTGVILNVFLIPAHLYSAAGKGLIICTGTAAVKPKNNPQSVVRCEQSTPSAADCPSGGKNLPKLLNRFTHKNLTMQRRADETRPNKPNRVK